MAMVSCGSVRYLGPDEKILNHQKIQAPADINKANLENLYTRKENRKLFGFMGSHLVWMYYTGLKRFKADKFIEKRDRIEARFADRLKDSTNLNRINNLQFKKSKKTDRKTLKIENGNDFMRWGEPLALFDTTEVKKTIGRINDFLFANGYLHGNSVATFREKNRKVDVTYQVMPGPQYLIDSIVLFSSSEKVLDILYKNAAASLVRKGSGFKQDNLIKERERIETILKNQGYFNFTRQLIEYTADTSLLSNHRVYLELRVEADAQNLKQFRIDTVKMVPDVGMEKYYSGERDQYYYRKIKYQFFGKHYHKKVLSERIFIHQDSLYSKLQSFSTQRQLANLDIFKFVNINYDTSDGQFIANIFASPLENYSWSNEAGVSVTQGFPGPYYSVSFKRRNLLRGLEILELNGRFGFEGVASATQQNDFYKSTEANLNGSITFPRFLLPLSGDQSIRLARYNPKSKLLTGYTYTARPEYQRSIITASSTLTWESSKGLQYSFTGTNLSIIRSDTSAQFGARLRALEAEGNKLINAFKPSFVSNMSFSVTWNQHNYGNTNVSSYFIRASAESGGTSLNIFSPSIITNWGLQPYKYLRLNFDVRRTQVINKHTLMAFRINSGIGYAYSKNRVLPYEKNFFVGGSNSVRAWRPRRLGQGSLPPGYSTNPEKNGTFDYRFEKPGDVLIEGSMELRQKLFGFVNYAVFVDAGNVWNLQSATDERSAFRPGKFLSEFGVGTGFGFRFDFTFLILRLDMGMKVFDPARPAGDRFVLDKVKFFKPFGTDHEPVIFNIGIGYPF